MDFLVATGIDAETLSEEVGMRTGGRIEDVEFGVEGGKAFVVKSARIDVSCEHKYDGRGDGTCLGIC